MIQYSAGKILKCAKCLCLLLYLTVFSIDQVSAQTYEKRVALLMGIGEYVSGRGQGIFSNLPIAVDDLELVSSALADIGFEVHIYSDAARPAQGRLPHRKFSEDYLQTSVRADDIDRIVRQMLTALTAEGQRTLLLVYFTGHGGVFGNSDRVLATSDSRLDLPSTFVRVADLLDGMFDLAPKTDKMLVVDACANRLGGVGKPHAHTAEELPIHLFSSSLGQASYFDRQLRRSVFTHYFVKALAEADADKGGNNDGLLDSEEVRAFVMARVSRHPQRSPRRDDQKTAITTQDPWGSGRGRITLFNGQRVENKSYGEIK